MRFFAVIVAFLFLSIGSVYAFDQKGLVLFLSFDEGSGKVAKDSSGSKNNGELQGDVTWVDGKHKKAVKISDNAANNMVVVKDHESLDITDQITFGTWVYLESVPDGSCSLITKADTYMIHSSNWRGKAGEIDVEPLLWPFDKWQTNISMLITVKVWHHVMGVFDGKELKTYIDGVFKDKRAFANKIAVTANDVAIGRDSRACCNTRRSALIMDDVVIFNRAISDIEVKAVMAGGTIGVEANGCLSSLWGQIKTEF